MSRSRFFTIVTGVAALTMLAMVVSVAFSDRSPHRWRIHAQNRPQPPQVNPGEYVGPIPAPSDAIVLFDGTNLDAWQHHDGADPRWRVVDGAMQVVPESGDIRTRETFGDVQLHIEFKTYPDSPGRGQSRSNSGVFFGPYEVQVLDNFENRTYPDGMAGSIYGQYPPLVNASRPAGQWQTFDIVWRRPHFNEDGTVERPARLTVFHNNVLVQDSEELIGPTSHANRQHYVRHDDKLPIRLQDHRDDPIHFRNIWVRELE